MKIDYKLLLEKYMQNILECTGNTHVEECFLKNLDNSEQIIFSKEEENALYSIKNTIDRNN